MRKVVVVGLDGLDWLVVRSLMDRMPVTSRLAAKGWAGEIEAVFPPDSIPSWISIFTGLDPSRHGILESVDYFKKDARKFSVDTKAFKGRTFWDRASDAGRKVIVVNPLLAYPPWDVDGLMASGPVFISGSTAVAPDGAAGNIDIPPLGGIVDFPEKKELAAFYEKTKTETLAITEFTARMMETREWDLTFMTLLTTDRVFHFFWRFFDREDPTWPGEGEFSDVIPDFHELIDRCVGRLIEAAGEDAIFILVSDHGHAMRPPLLFNLNQLLLDAGFLESRIKGPKLLSPRYLLDRTKNAALETLHRLDLEDLAYRFAHVFPWTRKLKKSDFMTEPTANLATASSFGGTNPFGGVEISAERCRAESLDYEEVRNRIIDLLLNTMDGDGTPYFLWARRREEIYDGDYIDRYPDILYELRPEFGTSWSVHLPLVTINPRHRKISGGHRKNSVFIAGPLDGMGVREENLRSLNLHATILALLGIEGENNASRSIITEGPASLPSP